MSKVIYEKKKWVLLDDVGNRQAFESKHELEQYLDLCDQYLTLRGNGKQSSLDLKPESE